nr:hypothetical protein [Pseudomonas sp. phDV1]
MNTWVSFQSAEQPLLGQFSVSGNTQLDTADIREVDGYPCFDFCPDAPNAFEAKRIKTGEARQVPIHPRLIELGFLDYVNEQRQAKQKKLLGDGLAYLKPRNKDVNHSKEGWAKDAGQFFNDGPKSYLREIGLPWAGLQLRLMTLQQTLAQNDDNICMP